MEAGGGEVEPSVQPCDHCVAGVTANKAYRLFLAAGHDYGQSSTFVTSGTTAAECATYRRTLLLLQSELVARVPMFTLVE